MALHIDDPQVLLEFPDDRVTWHHRVLLRRLRDAVWVVVTPDSSVVNLLPLARGCVIPRHVGTTHLFATAIDDEPEGPRLEAARSAAIMGMTARAAAAAPSANCSLRGGASAVRPMVCTIFKEDGARIGQLGRDGALLASTFSIRSSVASGSSGATTPGPNGETIAGCVARAQNS